MRPARLLLAVPLFLIYPALLMAQTGPGCGPANIKFDVTTMKQPPAAPAAQGGKALVYFLQDDFKYDTAPRPTTRFGVDGTWVGATHANSFFYVFVDAGEHHVCANWQSAHFGTAFGVSKRQTSAIALTAEAGKTYFLRAQDFTKMDHTGGENDVQILKRADVVLAPVDADEAQVLISSLPSARLTRKIDAAMRAVAARRSNERQPAAILRANESRRFLHL